MKDRQGREVTDTELLDYLDQLETPEGHGWILRESSTDRGWRLHTTSRPDAYNTPRAAILAARLFGPKKGGLIST